MSGPMTLQGWVALLVVAAAAAFFLTRLKPRSGSPGCGCGGNACGPKKRR